MTSSLKVLVPTDFSEASRRAVEFAAGIHSGFELEIYLMHVVSPIPEIPVETSDASGVLMRKAEKRYLEDLKYSLQASFPLIQFHTIFAAGDPVEEIIRAVLHQKMDWVIIGSHGASGLQKFLFGSVTAGVVEKSECPVLVIPEKTFYQPVKTIVYATNYLDQDVMAIKNLSLLIKVFDAELYVLHVNEKAQKERRKWEMQFEKEMLEAAGSDKVYFGAVTDKDVERGLESFVESVHADLLVMYTRKRSFLEKFFDKSLTKRLSYHTKTPLLVFHGGEEGAESTSL